MGFEKLTEECNPIGIPPFLTDLTLSYLEGLS